MATRTGNATDLPDDHRVLALFDFIRQLTPEERVGLIKAYRPNLTVGQIADACGVSERTVFRSKIYRKLRQIEKARRPSNSKWRGRKRRRIEPPEGEHDSGDPGDTAA